MLNTQTVDAREWYFNVNHPYFMKNPPREVMAQFTVNADGRIIDGPRQHPNEPIDYTDLLSNDAIINTFSRLLYVCEYTTGECDTSDILIPLGRWEIEDLNLYITQENASDNSRLENLILDEFNRLYAHANIKVTLSDSPRYSALAVAIGTKDYFLDVNTNVFKAINNNDVINNIWNIFKNEKGNKIYFDFMGSERFKCLNFTSSYYSDSNPHNWHSISYAESGDIEKCITQLAYGSFGFIDDINALSSVMVQDGSYKIATKLDLLILKLLFSDELQAGMPALEAMKIAERILPQMR